MLMAAAPVRLPSILFPHNAGKFSYLYLYFAKDFLRNFDRRTKRDRCQICCPTPRRVKTCRTRGSCSSGGGPCRSRRIPKRPVEIALGTPLSPAWILRSYIDRLSARRASNSRSCHTRHATKSSIRARAKLMTTTTVTICLVTHSQVRRTCYSMPRY